MVLLIVDSVNALYNTIAELLTGDVSFVSDPARIQLLKILVVFSLGSLTGLVSLSHLLAYVIKHFKSATYAVIIGFIAGSLGVVWPWKNKQYEFDASGAINYDANGQPIINGYER